MEQGISSLLKPVNLSEVSKVLSEMQLDYFGKDSPQLRYNINFIVPISSKESEELFEKAFTELGANYPCRYFLVHISDEFSGLEAEAGIYRDKSNGELRALSEIVRVRTNPESLKALPSVIHAQRIEGITTELLLIDQEAAVRAEPLISLADRLIIDSRRIKADEKMLRGYLCRDCEVSDLKWAALSPWREQLREVFDRKILRSMIKFLTRVNITSHSDESRAGYLLAGWMIDSLDCSLRSFGADGFDCFFSDGESLKLSLDIDEKAEHFEEVSSLELLFDTGTLQTSLKIFVKGDELVTDLKLEDHLKVHRKVFDKDSFLEVIKRVFVVGESMENYQSALETAIELRSLHAMYRG